MAASILKRARERRDAAFREAHMWEEFIRRYEELRKAPIAPTLFAMLEAGSSARAGAAPGGDGSPIEGTPPRESEMAKTIALVDAVLDERGRPMLLHDLYNEITRRGLAISGKFPRANLGSRLSNAGKYISLNKKTGWWFKDRPCPISPFEGPQSEDDSRDDETAAPNKGGLFDTPWGNAA